MANTKSFGISRVCPLSTFSSTTLRGRISVILLFQIGVIWPFSRRFSMSGMIHGFTPGSRLSRKWISVTRAPAR